jgi:hypothetical protein
MEHVWKVVLLLPFLFLCVNCTPRLTPPPSSDNIPGLQLATEKGFKIVQKGATYTATSYSLPSLEVEIDCDDVYTDDHYFGITPILNGRRLDGALWDSHFGLITPDFDAGETAGDVQCTTVENVADRLLINFEVGSYQNLKRDGPDKPVPLHAEFYVDEQNRLVAELSGIYYILPTTRNSTINISYGGMTQTQLVSNPTSDLLIYFDHVTYLDVFDSLFGHFTVDTNIDRLQFQVRSADPRFEFDLDHSYKDLGQEVVNSKVTFY